MKLYVKPSLEVSKFSVEDIITVSGSGKVEGVMNGNSIAENAIYNQYLDNENAERAANVVEFMW